MVVTLCSQAHQWLVFRAVWFDSKLLIKDESIKTPLSRVSVAFPNLRQLGLNKTFDGIIGEATQLNSSALNKLTVFDFWYWQFWSQNSSLVLVCLKRWYYKWYVWSSIGDPV